MRRALKDIVSFQGLVTFRLFSQGAALGKNITALQGLLNLKAWRVFCKFFLPLLALVLLAYEGCPLQKLASKKRGRYTITKCFTRNKIKDPHRYMVQGSDTTMMTIAPQPGQ